MAHDHRAAQDWTTWVDEGYVDMVNISGYCYPGQYGEKHLEIFESRLRKSVELVAQTGKSIPVSFALGVETSHGKVSSAHDVERYLKAARRASASGTALFTWSTAQPYLDELAKSGSLERFAKMPGDRSGRRRVGRGALCRVYGAEPGNATGWPVFWSTGTPAVTLAR